jgi:NAD(P)-dependent dehydrogenase (short-subunit alcohol dehydrogenase family)
MADLPVMIVTGGSRGIGAAIAKRAAGSGYNVCVNYTAAEDRAQEVVKAIRAGGGEAVAIRADVSKPQDVQRLFEEASRARGPLRALVNNAGIDFPSSLAEAEVEAMHRILDTNLFGPILCTREAVQRMSTKRGGHGGVIVNISSIAAVHGGMPGDCVYAASKGGLDSFTLGMAKEVAGEGIRVCAVRPGIIRTEMWQGQLSEQEVEEAGKRAVPLGRVGEADEIAGLVTWLCSDQAGYMTGAIMNVSGGREIFIHN